MNGLYYDDMCQDVSVDYIRTPHFDNPYKTHVAGEFKYIPPSAFSVVRASNNTENEYRTKEGLTCYQE